MKYCKRCLYPANHPLGLTFDKDGICSGCRVHEEKDSLDWAQRSSLLEDVFAAYRGKGCARHDCIVPVSGARDSQFIVDVVKRVYGMNPLLVSYNRHFNTERGIRNLAYLRGTFDGDYMQLVVQPQRIKKITRQTIRRMGSMYWHVLAGQTVWPVQVAVRLKIPLIIWGAHQGTDQVGMFSHLDEVEMTRKYRFEHDLMCCEAEDLLGGEEKIEQRDIEFAQYPNDRELSRVGVRGIYLNNYLRWDTKAQHESMIERYGYETADQARTFDRYSDVDCQHYSGLHDHIKYLKWGYGKVTDHASREIRLRRMTREQGIDLVRTYCDIAPNDKQAFLAWVEMSEETFDSHIDRFRDPAIWERVGGIWRLRDSVLLHAQDEGVEAARLSLRETQCSFALTPSRAPDVDESRYVLMARGHVDGVPVRKFEAD